VNNDNDKYTEMEMTTFDSRKHIRLLAAFMHVLKNGRLPMQDCLQLAEGIDTEAQIVDGKQVRKWIEDQRALELQGQPKPAPVNGKVM
jgi:hypothetical protein